MNKRTCILCKNKYGMFYKHIACLRWYIGSKKLKLDKWTDFYFKDDQEWRP